MVDILKGLVQAEPQPTSTDTEWPKWVVPHESHIVTDAHGHQVPQGFDDSHWDRVSRKFSVLVKNKEEEDRALASKFPEETPPEPVYEPAPETIVMPVSYPASEPVGTVAVTTIDAKPSEPVVE